ncbi:MAG TPA: condensation domain-containing protein, partial [Polyangiales bacterium]
MNRLLTPAERMTDRFDQAYTLNFSTIVTLRGPLSEAQLLRALRCLERRHPLLRARVEREGGAPRFVADQAAEIPLHVEQAALDTLLERANETLAPCAWQDAGPHAALIWLQHGPEHGSLLLRQHHLVSDGSSGILLMRDLLRFVAQGEPAQVEPLPSPGQDAFFPEDFGALKAQVLEQLQQRPPKPSEALRVSRFEQDQAIEARRSYSCRVQLDQATSQALAQRARAAGASVHGALMAAIARGLADETGHTGSQRLVHPVDLRRYLRELMPAAPAIGDVVGYYVTSVTTEHALQPGDALGPLARAITEGVRAGKAAREPLISAPIRGPLLVERTATLDLAGFRQ